jgi:23S rRNA (cytosine1962-C5)-methyltransferase
VSAKVFLRKKIKDRIQHGHPWVFNNEVGDIVGDAQKGDLVNVYSSAGSFVGKGFFNADSQILVRIVSYNEQDEINLSFFETRFQAAWKHRQAIGYVENCRLIFGEADFLSGLIIDKFNKHFVIQTISYGMDQCMPLIVEALQKVFGNDIHIYERNDVPVREVEGMVQKTGFLTAPFDTNIIINENGFQFHVDLINGQKTGYFLEQQDNRRAIQHIVKGADVLEAFSYTGTFGVHAACYGAKSVYGIDISETAVACANANAQLNGVDKFCRFEAMNAFDVLKQWVKEGKQYDVVMIDPPAFTKSRANIQKAITGYKEINLRAMRLVKPGGYLVSSSCTSLVDPELFLNTIKLAAKDARRTLRQVTFQTQASDHPILWAVPNTQYLKFLIVQVL